MGPQPFLSLPLASGLSAAGHGQLGLSPWRWAPTEVDPAPEKTLGGAAGGRAAGRGLRDRLLDFRAHPGADLAGVRRALQLPVRVYVAAQPRLFVSKGPFCLGPSRRGPAARLAPGGMAHDPACRQAT